MTQLILYSLTLYGPKILTLILPTCDKENVWMCWEKWSLIPTRDHQQFSPYCTLQNSLLIGRRRLSLINLCCNASNNCSVPVSLTRTQSLQITSCQLTKCLQQWTGNNSELGHKWLPDSQSLNPGFLTIFLIDSQTNRYPNNNIAYLNWPVT